MTHEEERDRIKTFTAPVCSSLRTTPGRDQHETDLSASWLDMNTYLPFLELSFLYASIWTWLLVSLCLHLYAYVSTGECLLCVWAWVCGVPQHVPHLDGRYACRFVDELETLQDLKTSFHFWIQIQRLFLKQTLNLLNLAAQLRGARERREGQRQAGGRDRQTEESPNRRGVSGESHAPQKFLHAHACRCVRSLIVTEHSATRGEVPGEAEQEKDSREQQLDPWCINT